ncbi:hypothetical protein SCUP234_01908 [Seiridium cupressi]
MGFAENRKPKTELNHTTPPLWFGSFALSIAWRITSSLGKDLALSGPLIRRPSRGSGAREPTQFAESFQLPAVAKRVWICKHKHGLRHHVACMDGSYRLYVPIRSPDAAFHSYRGTERSISMRGKSSPHPSDGTLTPKIEDLEFWDEVLGYSYVQEHVPLGYPGDEPPDYSILFDIFARYRSVVDREVESDSHGFLVEKAMSSPALLHSALLLSALRWTWYSGSSENIQKSCLQHKLEAVKFVNERVQDPATVATQTTITSVAALAMAEILANQAPPPIGDGTLLHDLIVCTTQGLCQVTMRHILEMTQSIDGCANTLTLFIEPEVQRLSEEPTNWNKTVGEIVSTKAFHERTDYTVPRTEAESRARFLQCCLKVATVLGPGNLDFFILNWFIEALIDELAISESAMLRDSFPRHAWLWAAMMARVAATSARHCNISERQQANEWKKITNRKIRLVTRAAKLKTWNEVEISLRSWVWRNDLLNAFAMREIWEEAMIDCEEVASDTVAPLFLDKRLHVSDEYRKPIIIEDEAFDQYTNNTWIF